MVKINAAYYPLLLVLFNMKEIPTASGKADLSKLNLIHLKYEKANYGGLSISITR